MAAEIFGKSMGNRKGDVKIGMRKSEWADAGLGVWLTSGGDTRYMG